MNAIFSAPFQMNCDKTKAMYLNYFVLDGPNDWKIRITYGKWKLDWFSTHIETQYLVWVYVLAFFGGFLSGVQCSLSFSHPLGHTHTHSIMALKLWSSDYSAENNGIQFFRIFCIFFVSCSFQIRSCQFARTFLASIDQLIVVFQLSSWHIWYASMQCNSIEFITE